MAKTYSASEVSVRDQVRGQLGDTGSAEPMVLADETIDSLMARFGVREGSALCAERLAGHYSRLAMDWMEANRREMYRDREKSMLELARRIRGATSLGPDGVTEGGIAVGLGSVDLDGYRVD